MKVLQLEKFCICCNLETFGYVIGYLNFVISIMSIGIILTVLALGTGKIFDQIFEKNADDHSIGFMSKFYLINTIFMLL